jgi:hypothetical protein
LRLWPPESNKEKKRHTRPEEKKQTVYKIKEKLKQAENMRKKQRKKDKPKTIQQ